MLSATLSHLGLPGSPTIPLCPHLHLQLDLIYCRAEIEEGEMEALIIAVIWLSAHPSIINSFFPWRGWLGPIPAAGGGGYRSPAHRRANILREESILRCMSVDCGRKLEYLDWTHSARRTCWQSRKKPRVSQGTSSREVSVPTTATLQCSRHFLHFYQHYISFWLKENAASRFPFASLAFVLIRDTYEEVTRVSELMSNN